MGRRGRHKNCPGPFFLRCQEGMRLFRSDSVCVRRPWECCTLVESGRVKSPDSNIGTSSEVGLLEVHIRGVHHPQHLVYCTRYTSSSTLIIHLKPRLTIFQLIKPQSYPRQPKILMRLPFVLFSSSRLETCAARQTNYYARKCEHKKKVPPHNL